MKKTNRIIAAVLAFTFLFSFDVEGIEISDLWSANTADTYAYEIYDENGLPEGAFVGDATWADNSPVNVELPPHIIYDDSYTQEYIYTPRAERYEWLSEQIEADAFRRLDFLFEPALTRDNRELTVNSNKSISDESTSSEQMNIYLEIIHEELYGSETDIMLRELILAGYPTEQVLYAYGMSRVLELDIYELLPELEAPEISALESERRIDIRTDDSLILFDNLTETDRYNFELLAEDFGVCADVLIEFADKNDFDFRLMEHLSNYAMLYVYELSSLVSPVTIMSSSGVAGDVPTKEYGAPYSYDYNSAEKVNLNTGGLVYEVVDYVLPGINGLDLVIGRRYDSENSNFYNTGVDVQWGGPIQVHFTSTKNDYFNSIGHGWSFMFSSIEFGSGYQVLHLADGRSFTIENIGNTNPTLKYYTLTDLHLKREFGAYNNGSVSSLYTLTYKDGKKEYFDMSGKLIGIRDRYNNTIKLVHSGLNGYPRITITDTLNRITTISSSVLSNGLRTVTVTLPSSVSFKYTVQHTVNFSYLINYTDPMNIETNYSYELKTGNYGALNSYMQNLFLNLTGVTHPTGARSEFIYEEVTRNRGQWGREDVYRLTTRRDIVNSVFYNVKTYTYSANNYTGWPSFSSWANLPFPFTYQTTVTTAATGVSETHTFDNKHLTTLTEAKHGAKKVSDTLYEYNANNLPVRITQKDYDYTDNSVFMQVIRRYEYDNMGNVTASWSPRANGSMANTTYTYNSAFSQLTSIAYKQDASTAITVSYGLDSQNRHPVTEIVRVNDVQRDRTDWTYDSFGNILSERRNGSSPTAGGVLTQFTYDCGAYLASVCTSGVLTATGANIAGANGFAAGTVGTRYEYDNLGRMTKMTDPRGNTTSYQYNARNDLIRVINPDNSQQQWARSYTQNYITFTDERGGQTTTCYNALGLLYEIRDGGTAAAVLNRKGYDSLSRISTDTTFISAGTSNVATYTYDHLSRITDITARQNSTIIARETYSYAIASNLYKTIKTVVGDSNAPSVVTTSYLNNLGQETQTGFMLSGTEYINYYQYDYLGNMTQFRSALDVQKGRTFTMRYEYDYAGSVTKETNTLNQSVSYEYDYLGRNTGITDPNNRQTLFTYDNLGRLLTQRTPFELSGSTIRYAQTRYTYDQAGNITREEMLNNLPGSAETWTRTDYTYNNRNFLTQADSYSGSNGTGTVSRTQYAYDAAGNMTAMATGQASALTGNWHTAVSPTTHALTKYTYDKQGNVTKITDALGQEETYAYDFAGNVTSKTDRKGIITNYTYDGLGRLSSTSSGGITISQTYTLTGQLRTQTNTTGTITYTYDALGRVSTQTDPGSIIKNYTYDIGGNRLTFTTHANSIMRINTAYTYDELSRLKTVSENSALQATYNYDANGNRANLVYPNGITAIYTYNLANLVTKVENKAGTAIRSSYDYTYCLDGNQRTKKDHTGKTIIYTYDALGRLAHEVENDAYINYIYDTRGNRTIMINDDVITNYTYNLNNQLTQTKSGGVITTYTYDANGNQLSDGTTIYTYNNFNQVTSAVVNGVTTTYTYRPDGLRYTKTTNGINTTHFWDGANIVFEFAGSAGIKYIRGINLICAANGTQSGTILHYYLYNAHGDVVQLTNASGAVTKIYDYDAFGVERGVITNGSRYSGADFDASSGIDTGDFTEHYVNSEKKYMNAPGSGISTDTINLKSGSVSYSQVFTEWIKLSTGTVYVLEFDYWTEKSSDRFTYGLYAGRTGAWIQSGVINGSTSVKSVRMEISSSNAEMSYAGLFFVSNQHIGNVYITNVRFYKDKGHGIDPNDTNPFRYCGEYWDAAAVHIRGSDRTGEYEFINNYQSGKTSEFQNHVYTFTLEPGKYELTLSTNSYYNAGAIVNVMVGNTFFIDTSLHNRKEEHVIEITQPTQVKMFVELYAHGSEAYTYFWMDLYEINIWACKSSETYYLRNRHYSPKTGRFTQEDPYWRMAGIKRYDPQGLNLYAYCVNNPVKYKDPWGLFAVDDVLYILKQVANGNTNYSTRQALDILKWIVNNKDPIPNIVVHQVDDNVYIKVNFKFIDSTDGATIEGMIHRNAFMQGVLNIWNGQIGRYSVLTLADERRDGIIVNLENTYGTSNVSGTWSPTTPGIVTMYRGIIRDYTLNEYMGVAAHEFGHLLGISTGDDYGNNWGNPAIGVHRIQDNNIMADANGINYENNINFALRAFITGNTQTYPYLR